MSKQMGRSAVILLVEDNPDDQELTRRALARGKLNNDFYVVEDGAEALDFLYQRGKYSDPEKAPRPDLILLDLNLPKMSGREVLQEIKGDHSLSYIPVIVMTTSRQEEDVVRSYNLGCNSFIQKPIGRTELMRVLEMVENYWFEIVVLPPRD